MSDTSEAKGWITGIADLFGRRPAQILIILILIGVSIHFLVIPYLTSKAAATTPTSRNSLAIPSDSLDSDNDSTPSSLPTEKLMKSYAYNAGQRLQQCCGPGGKNGRVSVTATRIDEPDRRCIIQMTVTWQGRKTGNTYSISGKLITDFDGATPEWRATGEHGIVLHNCATGCDLGRTVRY